MKNQWKICRNKENDTYAFCYQWGSEKDDFFNINQVVRAIAYGSWCGTHPPRPENAASDDDMDLQIITSPDPKTGKCMIHDYEPGDWISLRNSDVDLIPAAEFEESWEICGKEKK